MLCASVSALHTPYVQTSRMNGNQELVHGCTTSNYPVMQVGRIATSTIAKPRVTHLLLLLLLLMWNDGGSPGGSHGR
jgi:hypothetical protein